MLRSKVVGIGGVSRAGKSTLAQLLAERLRQDQLKVLVVHQDEYIVSNNEIPKIKNKLNWELPSTIDWDKLIKAIDKGKDAYDFIFVEGLFAFYKEKLNQYYAHKILVEISKMKFVNRKKEDLRWGASPEPDWYIEHIWQSYLVYCRPTLHSDYFTVNGSRHFDIEHIYTIIHS